MPLAPSVTPANADERQDVLPLLDSVEVKTGRPGRPPKKVKVLATDKGYDANELRLTAAVTRIGPSSRTLRTILSRQRGGSPSSLRRWRRRGGRDTGPWPHGAIP